MQTKICISCLVEKKMEEFCIQKGEVKANCRECARAKQKVIDQAKSKDRIGVKERKPRKRGYKMYKRVQGVDGVYRKVCPGCLKIKRIDTEYPSVDHCRFCTECDGKTKKEIEQTKLDNEFSAKCTKLRNDLLEYLKSQQMKDDRVLAAVFVDLVIEIIKHQENPQRCYEDIKDIMAIFFIS